MDIQTHGLKSGGSGLTPGLTTLEFNLNRIKYYFWMYLLFMTHCSILKSFRSCVYLFDQLLLGPGFVEE